MKLRVLFLASVFLLLCACGDTAASLKKTIEQETEISGPVIDEKIAALNKLREIDEAACADAAYSFLTRYNYAWINSLSYWIESDSGRTYVRPAEILSDYFALCERYGYTDVREAVADRVCESADPDYLASAAKELCCASPAFFELFLPKMLQAGWFPPEEDDHWASYTVSLLCDAYFKDAGDALGARFAFVSREIVPIAGVPNDLSPIPWTQPIPESDEFSETEEAGACLVLSRAAGSEGYDHDWQIEPVVLFCLPKKNRMSADGRIDTLILLDTTWEESGKYSSGQRAFGEWTNVRLIDAQTGALRCEAQRFWEPPSSFVMTNGNGDIYTAHDYETQEELMAFIRKAL